MGSRRVPHCGEGSDPEWAVPVVVNTRVFRWLEGRSIALRSLRFERQEESNSWMVTRTLHLLPLLLEEPPSYTTSLFTSFITASEPRASAEAVAPGSDDLLPLVPLDMIEARICVSLHDRVGCVSSGPKLAKVTARQVV